VLLRPQVFLWRQYNYNPVTIRHFGPHFGVMSEAEFKV
jgi:hypothetical protein